MVRGSTRAQATARLVVTDRESATLRPEEYLRSTYDVPFLEPGTLQYRIALLLNACWSYGTSAELITFLLALAAVSYVWLDGEKSLAAGLLFSLLGFQGIKCAIWVHRHRQMENTERARIRYILGRIANGVLQDFAWCRLTWFRPDPISNGIMIPFARYDPLEPDLQPVSRVYYPTGVSYTGLGVCLPNHYMVYECPPFHDLEELRDHYRRAIMVPDRILSRISEKMVRVRSIITYGVQPQEDGEVVGVLSVDLPDSLGSFQAENFHERRLRNWIEILAELATPPGR